MNHELPSVAGRMEMTHEAFESACRVKLSELQENHLLSDNSLFYLLCEAVRCSRESDAKSRAIESLIQSCDELIDSNTAAEGSMRTVALIGELENARKALGK